MQKFFDPQRGMLQQLLQQHTQRQQRQPQGRPQPMDIGRLPNAGAPSPYANQPWLPQMPANATLGGIGMPAGQMPSVPNFNNPLGYGGTQPTGLGAQGPMPAGGVPWNMGQLPPNFQGGNPNMGGVQTTGPQPAFSGSLADLMKQFGR